GETAGTVALGTTQDGRAAVVPWVESSCQSLAGPCDFPGCSAGADPEAWCDPPRREYLKRADQGRHEPFPALEGPQHRGTQIGSPRTNRFVDRMNRTLLGEGSRVASRTT